MRSSKHGFTVVEIILVVFIFSLVALAVYRVLAVAMKANDNVQAQSETFRALMATFHLIEHDLNNMVPYDFGVDSELRAFSGDAHAIRMIVPTENGLKVVRYVFNEARGDLIRFEQPFVDLLDGEPLSDEQGQIIFAHPALRNVQFFFGYLDKDKDREPLWKDQWQRGRLPFAVRLRLDVVEGRIPGHVSSFERSFFVPHGDWGEL
jgi:type II secretion system protein J